MNDFKPLTSYLVRRTGRGGGSPRATSRASHDSPGSGTCCSRTAPLPTPAGTIIGALLSLGNLAVVCLGLGLFWEWRLLSLAAEPWVRIRSLRSARAVAAPLTAIVIATGTAVSTALVNTAIAPLPAVTKTAPPSQEP